MTISKIDRATARMIQSVVSKHMKAAADELGMIALLRRTTFDDLTLEQKIEFRVKQVAALTTPGATPGVVVDMAAKTRFETFGARAGLDPSWFGKSFAINGVEYQITDYVPSRPKYPVSAKRVHDGKGFKFGAYRVKFLMEMAKSKPSAQPPAQTLPPPAAPTGIFDLPPSAVAKIMESDGW